MHSFFYKSVLQPVLGHIIGIYTCNVGMLICDAYKYYIMYVIYIFCSCMHSCTHACMETFVLLLHLNNTQSRLDNMTSGTCAKFIFI